MPTAVGGITRLKIVQKSPGVMIGTLVPPNAMLGALFDTGTMSVGLRYSPVRVPFAGHLELPYLRVRESTTSSAAEETVVARRERERVVKRNFMMTVGCLACGEELYTNR